MDFSSILFVALVVCAYIIRSALSSQKNKKPGGKTTTGSAAAENARARAAQSAARRKQVTLAERARKIGLPVADDGHVIRREDDISCRRFGHRHPEEDTLRFIPHDDPTEGYIILNGKRMLLSEADAYENTI